MSEIRLMHIPKQPKCKSDSHTFLGEFVLNIDYNFLQIIAVIIGFCYFGIDSSTQAGIQAIQGVVFVFVTENTFTPMYATLAEFPENKPLFMREYSAGLYDPSTYYLSKILSLVRIQI